MNITLQSLRVRSHDTQVGAVNEVRNDIEHLNQPEKIHEAFDTYLKAEEQHSNNVWGLRALLATSSTSAFGLIQASFATAQNCPPAVGGSTVKACGLAAGNVISAVIGAGGATISAKLLYDARSQVDKKLLLLNQELKNKLKGIVANDLIESCGHQLVSRISSLPDRERRLIQGDLAKQIPNVTGEPDLA